MNAGMRFEETDNEIKARKLREAKEQKAFEEEMAKERTGFLKVGNGKAVHHDSNYFKGFRTLCSSEGAGSGQIRSQISQVKIVEGPATCKRCLRMKSQAVEVENDPYAIITMKIDFSKAQRYIDKV